MRITGIEEAVKSESSAVPFLPAPSMAGIFQELDQMRDALAQLCGRLDQAGRRLIEHSDLCGHCETFQTCLLCDYVTQTIDGKRWSCTEELCAECRKELLI